MRGQALGLTFSGSKTYGSGLWGIGFMIQIYALGLKQKKKGFGVEGPGFEGSRASEAEGLRDLSNRRRTVVADKGMLTIKPKVEIQ